MTFFKNGGTTRTQKIHLKFCAQIQWKFSSTQLVTGKNDTYVRVGIVRAQAGDHCPARCGARETRREGLRRELRRAQVALHRDDD